MCWSRPVAPLEILNFFNNYTTGYNIYTPWIPIKFSCDKLNINLKGHKSATTRLDQDKAPGNLSENDHFDINLIHKRKVFPRGW